MAHTKSLRVFFLLLVFLFLACPGVEAAWKTNCKTDKITDEKSCALVSYVGDKATGNYLVVGIRQNERLIIIDKNPIHSAILLRIDKNPAIACPDTPCVGEAALPILKQLLEGKEVVLRFDRIKDLTFDLSGFKEAYDEAIKNLNIDPFTSPANFSKKENPVPDKPKPDTRTPDPAPIAAAQTPAPAKKLSTPQSQVSYDIVREWKINNGGFGRIIVVSPKFRNEEDLKLLGMKLRDATHNDRNAVIRVFDSLAAAILTKKEGSLNDEQNSFLDHHSIGIYTKNSNTGYHKFQIWVGGVGSTITTVDY